MNGAALANGTGSRLFPRANLTNKHLLPVGYAPMIWHPVWTLKQISLDGIAIVIGAEYVGDVLGRLVYGRDFDCRFIWKLRDEAGGIAWASMENFATGGGLSSFWASTSFRTTWTPRSRLSASRVRAPVSCLSLRRPPPP